MTFKIFIRYILLFAPPGLHNSLYLNKFDVNSSAPLEGDYGYVFDSIYLFVVDSMTFSDFIRYILAFGACAPHHLWYLIEHYVLSLYSTIVI